MIINSKWDQQTAKQFGEPRRPAWRTCGAYWTPSAARDSPTWWTTPDSPQKQFVLLKNCSKLSRKTVWVLTFFEFPWRPRRPRSNGGLGGRAPTGTFNPDILKFRKTKCFGTSLVGFADNCSSERCFSPYNFSYRKHIRLTRWTISVAQAARHSGTPCRPKSNAWSQSSLHANGEFPK